MKRKKISAVLAVLLVFMLSPVVAAEKLLVPVGQTVGLQLRDNTITIAAFDDLLGSEAQRAGLKIGDQIVKVNGVAVHNVQQMRDALEEAGDTARVALRRGSKELEQSVRLSRTSEGAKLGVYLKQGITGIGTVTWYDPATGKFGALGHGVNGSAGVLMQMAEGDTYPAQVLSVTKGTSGHPGQLKGSCDNAESCGQLLRNTPQGVFGRSTRGWQGEPLPIGQAHQVHLGQASIRSTVSSFATGDYSVEILKLYPTSRADGRNILLRVTDPALLKATGGIVQGMSGSPIIQDGRLIGAVTHVLVNAPDVGYGIFIENMLEAAG